TQRAASRYTSRGNRTPARTMHQSIAFALVPLVQSSGAAGDQGGSEDGVKQLHPGPGNAQVSPEHEPDRGAHQDEGRDTRLGECEKTAHDAASTCCPRAEAGSAARTFLRI